ncbi:hypothetical protein [Phenylobacterium sp. J367]|uniref:hypothetical protein n=1 Tax=Phenylobacterium sp. J367 TaxID=2898435 RepID=UPI00215078AE|nr:hypothetical protein [Phenylobacterium sp. J367]MCR5878992.1 hypothetical protein [Phenylobacterium sp. J367]
MSGSLRIRRETVGAEASGGPPPSEYLERLVKLIPTEIIGLYLGGKAAIQTRYMDFHAPKPDGTLVPPQQLGPNEDVAWVGWTAICFFALLAVRSWATKSHDRPQWGAVLIAAVSFLIWVYSFGDVFHLVWGIWDPLPATLLVLVWTFAVPIFYKGDETRPAAA